MFLMVKIPTIISLTETGSENRGMVLVTGIANPKPLSEYLGKYFGEIVHLHLVIITNLL